MNTNTNSSRETIVIVDIKLGGDCIINDFDVFGTNVGVAYTLGVKPWTGHESTAIRHF